jgi:hypothetical protein
MDSWELLRLRRKDAQEELREPIVGPIQGKYDNTTILVQRLFDSLWWAAGLRGG